MTRTAEPAELTCKELVELVTDYLEGGMGPEGRARFEEHLAMCEGCTSYVDQMRRTIEMLGRLTEESIPFSAKVELMQTFRHWKTAGHTGA